MICKGVKGVGAGGWGVGVGARGRLIKEIPKKENNNSNSNNNNKERKKERKKIIIIIEMKQNKTKRIVFQHLRATHVLTCLRTSQMHHSFLK